MSENRSSSLTTFLMLSIVYGGSLAAQPPSPCNTSYKLQVVFQGIVDLLIAPDETAPSVAWVVVPNLSDLSPLPPYLATQVGVEHQPMLLFQDSNRIGGEIGYNEAGHCSPPCSRLDLKYEHLDLVLTTPETLLRAERQSVSGEPDTNNNESLNWLAPMDFLAVKSSSGGATAEWSGFTADTFDATFRRMIARMRLGPGRVYVSEFFVKNDGSYEMAKYGPEDGSGQGTERAIARSFTYELAVTGPVTIEFERLEDREVKRKLVLCGVSGGTVTVTVANHPRSGTPTPHFAGHYLLRQGPERYKPVWVPHVGGRPPGGDAQCSPGESNYP